MKKESFGILKNREEAHKYTINNSNGMTAVVTDFGATLVSLFVKDKNGELRDVVLGFDDAAKYENDASYFGATVGRNCNRIANAKIEIKGVEYQLEDNDSGNNLHSGSNGVSRRLWEVKEQTNSSVVFEITDAHLNQGFPGNATMCVEYKLTEENEIEIIYSAQCDEDTVFNFTNHSYFNLNGHNSGNVFEQELMINARKFTPVNSSAIPSGELADVEGTPFDFTSFKKIGKDISVENEQLSNGNGYDHNYVIDKEGKGMALVARAFSDESGITMDTMSDCPGVQLYTANYVGTDCGKGGSKYEWRSAFCLETQYFPNSINEPAFESPITKAGEKYTSKTVYKFGIK